MLTVLIYIIAQLTFRFPPDGKQTVFDLLTHL